MSAAQKLQALKSWMQSEHLDAFVLPVADEFLSEYVPPHAMRLAWLTGFNGSAGAVLITTNTAMLFTDGRYTLQAEAQLDSGLYQIINISDITLTDWLAKNMPEKRIGYDAGLHSAKAIAAMQQKNIQMIAVPQNPIDALWSDRPKPLVTKAWRYEDVYAGESVSSKIARISQVVADVGADALFIAASESINWLLNIRGHDVECTPVVQAYALLHKDLRIELFVDGAKISDDLFVEEINISVDDKAAISASIQALSGKKLWVDMDATPQKFMNFAQQHHVNIIEKTDPIELAKALKNDTELVHMRRVHMEDGAALVSTFFWLEQAIARGEAVDEMAIDAMLAKQRNKLTGFVGLSFPAIVGAGAHGAIIHYRVTPETNTRVQQGELLLIDSGGQYLGGTTDVTRTLAIGTPKDEYKNHYTYVLKGHIALAQAVFPEGTTGSQLDALARQYLWQAGLDYDHGTGHGVGACLGVHEGPQRISKRVGGAALKVGMILSNEPGYYQNGSHGIRIENLVEVVEKKLSNGALSLGFSNLTLVPYDRTLMDIDQLTAAEINWVNAYHADVFTALSPKVEADVRAWLGKACAPI